MKKLIYIISVALGLTTASCNDFLNEEPESARFTNEFYKTVEQCEQGLTGVYNGLLPMAKHYLLLNDVRCDDVWTTAADDQHRDYVDLSVFNPAIYQLAEVNTAWVDLYELVYRANLVLEKMEGVEFSDESIKRSFQAEARFLRAYAYFDLVRYFGRVPLAMRTLSVSEASSLKQSEPMEVYEQCIIPDLQFAIENLLETPLTAKGKTAGAGHATPVAAKALLGRVYLTMAGFPLRDESRKDLAAHILKEVIDYAGTGRFWAEGREMWPHIWISDNDNKYHIFEIQYIAASNLGNPAVYFQVPSLSTEYGTLRMSGYRITMDEGLKKLFKENSDDIRYKYTYDSKEDFYTKFFEHKIKRAELGYGDIDDQIVDRTYFPINYPLIRLEVVMLMYAEIVGPTAEGIAQVNRIRTRAGLQELAGEELTPEGFAKAVDDERRRELAFEGIRWHDIVRHGNWQELVTRKFNNFIYDSEGNEVHAYYKKYLSNIKPGCYLLPIPDVQMKSRPGLYEQNEAYR